MIKIENDHTSESAEEIARCSKRQKTIMIDSNSKQSDEAEYNESYFDVLASIDAILKNNICSNYYPRMVFKHQLVSLIDNSVEIEEELEKLRTQNIIRMFSFPSKADIGIMRLEEYYGNIMSSSIHANEVDQKCLIRFANWIQSKKEMSFFVGDLPIEVSDNVITITDIEILQKHGFILAKRDTKAIGIFLLSHPLVSI